MVSSLFIPQELKRVIGTNYVSRKTTEYWIFRRRLHATPTPKAVMEQYTLFKHTLIKCLNGVYYSLWRNVVPVIVKHIDQNLAKQVLTFEEGI